MPSVGTKHAESDKRGVRPVIRNPRHARTPGRVAPKVSVVGGASLLGLLAVALAAFVALLPLGDIYPFVPPTRLFALEPVVVEQ
jgi:hypothetical protein